MAIEFLCPNGHKLAAPDSQAGRAVKCPRCGSVTRVPAVNGAAAATTESTVLTGSGKQAAWKSASGDSVAPATDEASGARDSKTKLPSPAAETSAGEGHAADGADKRDRGEESIVFLCPNGHKLNAPARLQGHAGQCPHCGAKFRIPLPDEPHGEAEANTTGDNEFMQLEGENGQAVEAFDLSSLTASAPAATAAAGKAEESDAMGPDSHPLARLVSRLWSEREHGGIVELHLAGGAMIVPEWFERRLSQSSHGLFAVQAADGTVTMTIVPWDSVSRVVVRGVVGLPDGMF
jgi:DNA-directed RNA polymerase subunit RPC12/RpoP